MRDVAHAAALGQGWIRWVATDRTGAAGRELRSAASCDVAQGGSGKPFLTPSVVTDLGGVLARRCGIRMHMAAPFNGPGLVSGKRFCHAGKRGILKFFGFSSAIKNPRPIGRGFGVKPLAMTYSRMA